MDAIDALSAIRAIETAPFAFSGKYRFQSEQQAEFGTLNGETVERAETLTLVELNSYLRTHERWHGNSLVLLKAAIFSERRGVFSRHADGLYYARNFSDSSQPFSNDLLDLVKLQCLFDERTPLLRSVLTAEAFDWLLEMIGDVHRAVVNEYMCHEAGHCLGYSVGEKYKDGFFRFGGRLRWPLIYLEEYRADTNSWSIADRLLKPSAATSVVAYTFAHRLGLAIGNLREGRPGAGYIPFLHFSSLLKRGALRLESTSSGPRLSFGRFDQTSLLEAALDAAAAVDRDINASEASQNHEDCAEASLQFAFQRLQDESAVSAFHDLIVPGENRPLPPVMN